LIDSSATTSFLHEVRIRKNAEIKRRLRFFRFMDTHIFELEIFLMMPALNQNGAKISC
jgi:hypothetical protein